MLGLGVTLGLSACVGAAPPPPTGAGSTSTGPPTPETTSGPNDTTSGISAGTQGSADSGTTQVDPTLTSDDTTTSDGGTATTTSMGSTSTGPVADCVPLISEALTGLTGTDGPRDWLVLANPCPVPYDLTPLSLAWGNANGYQDALDLVGVIEPGDCFVVGGPQSEASNFDPVFDMPVDISLTGSRGAIGLFDLPPDNVGIDTVPVDVVIYGEANNAGYIDTMGNVVPPMIDAAPLDVSLLRTSTGPTWGYGEPPTPNDCPML